MDLSVYISELLHRQGMVNIPQIGIFRQVKMRGYYNAEEGKLYPPHYETEFEYQPKSNDDSLLQYVISRSQVSAASARYFMDRYLFNLLQQAEVNEVMLGKMGTLVKKNKALHFKPIVASASSTAPFGFAPVDLKAQPEQPVEVTQAAETPAQVTTVETTTPPTEAILLPETTTLTEADEHNAAESIVMPVEPAEAEPLPVLQTETADPVAPVANAHPIEEVPTPSVRVGQTTRRVKPAPTPEPSPFTRPWFIGLTAAVVVIVGGWFLYQQMESDSHKFVPTATEAPDTTATKKAAEAKPQVSTPVVTQPDTVATTLPKTKDTALTAKPLQPTTAKIIKDTATVTASGLELVNTKNYKYILMSGAFYSVEEAKRMIDRYKAKGVNAGIVNNGPSKYVKVGLGFFETYADTQAEKDRLVKSKNLRPENLYVETVRKK